MAYYYKDVAYKIDELIDEEMGSQEGIQFKIKAQTGEAGESTSDYFGSLSKTDQDMSSTATKALSTQSGQTSLTFDSNGSIDFATKLNFGQLLSATMPYSVSSLDQSLSLNLSGFKSRPQAPYCQTKAMTLAQAETNLLLRNQLAIRFVQSFYPREQSDEQCYSEVNLLYPLTTSHS